MISSLVQEGDLPGDALVWDNIVNKQSVEFMGNSYQGSLHRMHRIIHCSIVINVSVAQYGPMLSSQLSKSANVAVLGSKTF